MKKLLSLIIVMGFFSCIQAGKEITKADLSFKFISFGSLYGANEQQIEEFEKSFDSIYRNPNASEQDKYLANYFEKLKRNELLTSPYIHLRINPDSTLVVYLSETEYKKVKDYKLMDLEQRKKKVELELVIKEKDSDLFITEKIVNVNEIDGITYWKK